MTELGCLLTVRDGHAAGRGVVGAKSDVFQSENAALKPITDAMTQITESGGKNPFSGTSFRLDTLIQPVISAANARYSTYEGGLTTPGCFEVVKWINFQTPLEISSAQLDQFRSELFLFITV